MSRQASGLRRALEIIDGLTKLKQTSLLVFSMYAAFIAAGGLSRPLLLHLELLGIGYVAIGSVTAINMYFDRDIDAAMPRTRSRPLPSGAVSPGAVLGVSAVLLAVSLAAAWLLVNPYYAAAIALGFVFDIVAYTLLLKRRTPLNIVAGAVAGGAPALGGWAAATGRIDAAAVLFSLIVAAWVPAHIWFLATFYREDYSRANVPMLPVVTDSNVVGIGVGLGALATGYAVAGLALLHAIGPLAAAYGLFMSCYLFKLAVDYVERGGDKAYARRAFVRVNMSLGLFYAILIAEKAASMLAAWL